MRLSRSTRRSDLKSRRPSSSERPYLARLRRLQSHIGPIISHRSVQLELAAEPYGPPADQLHLELPPVDERSNRSRLRIAREFRCCVLCALGVTPFPRPEFIGAKATRPPDRCSSSTMDNGVP